MARDKSLAIKAHAPRDTREIWLSDSNQGNGNRRQAPLNFKETTEKRQGGFETLYPRQAVTRHDNEIREGAKGRSKARK